MFKDYNIYIAHIGNIILFNVYPSDLKKWSYIYIYI